MFPTRYPRKEAPKPPAALSSSASSPPPRHGSKLPPQPLYQPSIYTFTCRGAYYVSTEFQQQLNKREGTCRGFRTQLELLSDMELNTRKGALEDFTYWSSGGEGSDSNYELEEHGGEQLDPQTKSILVSPTLIYKDDVLSSSSSPSEGKDGSSSSTIIIEKADDDSIEGVLDDSLLPEEELIQRQEWSCYGSTQVDYLLLKDTQTGVEKIAAVAPRNNGLTIRKIDADPGNHVTCIGLGPLSVVMDSIEVTDNDDKKNRISKARENALNNNNNKDKQQSKSTTPDQTSVAEGVAGKPTPETLAVAKESAARAIQFTSKVLEHMKSNATWLYENMQDDFATRTMESGQRIVRHIPETVNRTGSFMKKLVRRMAADLFDDDDDNNDDQPGRKKK